ncbi:RidA family protein [Kineococcus sp. NBC_00420]|uniref:RidA family protein n=1 Tax=Kineococcus sp. NBC_00420 TaxID=2903564 RepID=UPI002E1B3A29
MTPARTDDADVLAIVDRSGSDEQWWATAGPRAAADVGTRPPNWEGGNPAEGADVTRQTISTPDAPTSPFYSQGVKAGPQVFVSGTTGIDPSTGHLAGDTIQAQTRQALTNCRAVLAAGGASLDDVVEVGVLLAAPEDFAGMNEEYARWFPTDPPTRYAAKLGVEVPGLLVSIRMTAFTG